MSPIAIAAVGAIAAGFAAGFATSQSDRPAVEGMVATPETVLHDAINDKLGLIRSQLVDLEVDTSPGRAVQMQVPLSGVLYSLDMVPHSVRSEHYQVTIQLDDGSLVDVDPGPIRTLRGNVEGHPESVVAASMADDGLIASVMFGDGDTYWIEPVGRHIDGARPEEYVVYHVSDAVCEGVCGVNAMEQHAEKMREFGDPLALGSETCKVALIGIDADFQYYQHFGSSVENVEAQVNSIMNTINAQYEAEVGIRHDITSIIVRTSSASNPYTTNDAGNLLTQFRNHWNSNHGNVPRAVAHLFTGRSLNGSTIGIAYLGRICQISLSYGLSQRINPGSCMTDLTSHEIGHNWNAPHCNCPSHTMNPSLTCANQFASSSIATIVNFRNSRTCLQDCPPPGPTNNECQNTTVLSDGTHQFSNIEASTEGPAEPDDCTFFGDGDIQSDVWFGYLASCTGELTVSLCESNFNTKLALYNFTCPTESGTVIACDVDSCPSSLRSEITIPVTQGEAFRIRVGGHNGAQGNGVMTISCTPSPICVGDLNGDGVVDVSDMLEMLSAWGPCEGCDADLDGSGTVDVADLLLLLAEWGDC